MAINYVRFQRGTLEAYEALLEKGLIDKNTLYFIYADDDSSAGSLYMGEKIISGGDTNYVFSTLDELSDVEVTDAESNSFLVKDSATNNWIAKTPEQVAELIQEYIENSNNNEEVINLNADNLSIEILDNVIQLKNYGSNYYAFVPSTKDEDGNIVEESKYVLTEGFKAGLEPKVEETNNGLIISWYEPNSESIDDLTEEITNTRTSIEEINSEISTLKEINEELITEVSNLQNELGNPFNENEAATGLYKEIENLSSILDTKADTSNVYTKTETDSAIAAAVASADHLQRKIVNSTDDIDASAEDAHLYIYMVPTGLQYEDDKYDEYVIIDGFLEKVGSWEVDLTNYATKDEIIIGSVSDDFTIDTENNKQLILNNLSIDKITGLQDLLNNKVDAIENYTLLSPADKAKLDKLVIDEDNNLEISGSVNAENVIGLEEWLNENAGSVKGLSENNLTDDLYEKLSSILFITSVEETELNVDTNGKLSVLEIDQSKITGLEDALNSKASQTALEETNTLIQEILDSFAYYTTLEQHNADIEELRDILTWKDM